ATICKGDSVKLKASGGPTLYWYGSYYGTAIDSDSIYVTPPLQGDSTFYVAAYNSICYSVKSEVKVKVNPASLPPSIIGDTLVCSYDSISLSTPLLTNAFYHWTGPNNFSFSGPAFSIYPVNAFHAGYYYLQVNDSFCTSPVDSIHININAPP